MLARLNSNAYQFTKCAVSVVGLAIRKVVKKHLCPSFSGRQVAALQVEIGKPLVLLLVLQYDVPCLELSLVVAYQIEDVLACRLQQHHGSNHVRHPPLALC